MRFLPLVIVSIFLSAIAGLAYKLEQARPNRELQDLLYLPKKKELRRFAFGFEAEYSNVLWVLSLQAFYKHVFFRERFENINEVYKTIADLDPHFKESYATGAVYIAIIRKSALEGVRFLESRVIKDYDGRFEKFPEREAPYNKPWLWEILGRTYWLERHILALKANIPVKKSTERALKAIAKAEKLGGGYRVKVLLQFLALRDKFSAFDIITWLLIYEDANKSLQNYALQRIQQHIIQRHIEILNARVKQIHSRHRTYPKKIDQTGLILREPTNKEMIPIAKHLSSIIKRNGNKGIPFVRDSINKYISSSVSWASLKQKYLYDNKTGKIESTFAQKRKLYETIRRLQNIVDRPFYSKYNRFPKNFEEVIEKKFLFKLPKLPLNKKYTYDPVNGRVGYTPIIENE